MYIFFFVKYLRVPGQSWDLEVFGRVLRSWDSPGTLGLSQRPRVPTCSRIIFFFIKELRVPGS